MPITVNHSTPADDSFSASGATAWNANHSLVGVGTMAEQNANNVAITGGSISGVSGIGTVTAVTGTAPVVSSGGNTPAISIPKATTSVDGYLSATDWTTFNAKQPAGTYVTSVAATSPVTSSGGATPTIAIPAATTSVSGYLTATDWTTFNNKGLGTVTSVSGTSPISVATGTTTPVVSLDASYGDTQNPYASKTANYILAAPNGSAGAPTFRALVSADIPALSYIPYTGAASAVDLNAQTLVNIAHLGIGTTTVPTILMRAVGNNNSSSRIAMRGYSSDANSSSMRVTKFRGTTAAPQAPQSGDSLGKFELAGYGTTSSDGYPQASFEGVATEAWGAVARGTKTVFKVTPNTTTTQVIALTLNQDKTAVFENTVTALSGIGGGAF